MTVPPVLALHRLVGSGLDLGLSPLPLPMLAHWDASAQGWEHETSVDVWPNLTGDSSFDLTQTNGSLQPTYQTTQTGFPSALGGIIFDGTRRLVREWAAEIPQPNTVLLAGVLHEMPSGTDNTFFNKHNTTTGSGFHIYRINTTFSNHNWRAHAGTDLNAPINQMVDTVRHIHRIIYDGPNSEIAIDGDVIASGDAGAHGCAGWMVGLDPILNSATSLNGAIGEIVFYDRRLTPEEIAKAEAHLMEKWDI